MDVESLDVVSPGTRAAHLEETADEDSDGASAITTRSHREDMIFGLKALFLDSEQILDFLTAKAFSDTTVAQGFQQPDSRGSTKLRKLLSRLRDSCEAFGKSDDLIPLASQPTVQKLLGARHWQEVGLGQWRPDALFQLANLATFAAAVLGPDAHSSHDFGILQTMWEQFPSPFTYGFEESANGSLSVGYSRLLDQTFGVGLEIRTQFAIALLSERRSDHNFDPDVVLNQVFFVGDDEDSTQLLGFNAEGFSIHDKFLPQTFQRRVSQRIQALQGGFSEHVEGSVDVESLTASFPWEKFLAQTMSWVQTRAAELSQQIDDQGGINIIQESLQRKASSPSGAKSNDVHGGQHRALMSPEKEVGSPRKVSPVSRPALPTRGSRQPKPPRKSMGEKARRLMALKAQVAQRLGTAEVTGDAGAQLQQEAEETPALGDDFEPHALSDLQYLVRSEDVEAVDHAYTTLERQKRQSNKENIDTAPCPKTFVDPQDNAQRVSWDDSQEVFSDGPRNHVSSQKRRRNHTQEGHDADEDFETATQGAADKRRRELRNRTGQPKTTTRVPSKRIRSEIPESVPSVVDADEDADDDADDDQQLANTVAGSSLIWPSQPAPPSAQPARDPLRSSHNTNTSPISYAPPLSTAQELEHVRQTGREKVMTIKPRPVQSHIPYSAAEEERLIELIEDHGISYAFLKQKDQRHPDGSLLRERTQIQLKDKAQELKFQYLK